KNQDKARQRRTGLNLIHYNKKRPLKRRGEVWKCRLKRSNDVSDGIFMPGYFRYRTARDRISSISIHIMPPYSKPA
ncbi:hypothetical protein, partial [Neisseria gonorrhoeae]